jgi:hypothetical protein
MASPTATTEACDATGSPQSDPRATTPITGGKRPRIATTFILLSGERFELTEAGVAAFPEGLLHRLATSELTARDEYGCIPFNFPCDPNAFAHAIAEHEHRGKYGDRCGTAAALTVPINPQAVDVL